MTGALRQAIENDSSAVERASLSSCTNIEDVRVVLTNCFKTPLQFEQGTKTIPKVTLVVGAGKGDRAKFDEELPKWVTQVLRSLDYKEDKSASAVSSCAGSFKFQHDTGKNEVFIHVFPLVEFVSAKPDDDEEEEEQEHVTGIDKAKWMCLVSTMDTFKEMVESKLGTWSCKRQLVTYLKEQQDTLLHIEQQLVNRISLSPAEQKLFDSADKSLIEEKIVHLRSEMVKHVDENHLTKHERKVVLEQLQTRLQESQEKGNAAAINSLQARIKTLEGQLDEKSFFAPLKHASKLRQLWAKSLPLEKLQEQAGMCTHR